MKRSLPDLKKYLPAAVLFVVFLVAALAIPFDKTCTTYWVAFLFCVVSVGVLAFVLYRWGADETVQSRYYRMPILRVSALYVAVQMTLGFIVMGFASVCPVWVPLVLFVALCGAAAVGVLFSEDAGAQTEQTDDRTDDDRRMRLLTQEMATVTGRCADPGLSQDLAALAERFRYSDPVGSTVTIPIEDAMSRAVTRLKGAVAERDYAAASRLVSDLDELLEERNRLCMAYKQ